MQVEKTRSIRLLGAAAATGVLLLALAGTLAAQDPKKPDPKKQPPPPKTSVPAQQPTAPVRPAAPIVRPTPPPVHVAPPPPPAAARPAPPGNQQNAQRGNNPPSASLGGSRSNNSPASPPNGARGNNPPPTPQNGAGSRNPAANPQPGARTGNPSRQAPSANSAPPGNLEKPGRGGSSIPPVNGRAPNNPSQQIVRSPQQSPQQNGRNPAPNAPPLRANAAPGPRPDLHAANGASAHFSPHGEPRVVQTQGYVVNHGPAGIRTVRVERAGRVIVANSAGRGYVERGHILVGGHTFVQRTYYAHGVSYARYYQPVMYRGVSFAVYTPVRYWTPGFYTWAYTPWAAPVSYRWGWAGSSWLGYYGGYFQPYPVYNSPALWLTDYLIAAALQDAYQARADAAAQAQDQSNMAPDPAGGPVALTPEVKQAIADEVQQQLAEEQTASAGAQSNALPSEPDGLPILAGNQEHTLLVSSAIMVDVDGQECGLTQGDVVRFTPAANPDPNTGNVQVLASKSQDCRVGAVLPVPLTDLQEMENHMRESLDVGLADMQQNRGASGLPSVPTDLTAQVTPEYVAELPPADPDVAGELQTELQGADRAEGELLGQVTHDSMNAPAVAAISAPSPSHAHAPPAATGPGRAGTASTVTPVVTKGQTVSQVVAALGRPMQMLGMGVRKTYVYKTIKVIFINGIVSAVQ